MTPPTASPPLRYLVTGGAGFIGSHLADALLAHGDLELPPGAAAARQSLVAVRHEGGRQVRGAADAGDGRGVTR
jgi:nucleoside-diphosphate-sugar epimerase